MVKKIQSCKTWRNFLNTLKTFSSLLCIRMIRIMINPGTTQQFIVLLLLLLFNGIRHVVLR